MRKKEAIAFGQRLRAALAYKGETVQSFAESLTKEEREEFRFSKSTLDRVAQGVYEVEEERRVAFLARRVGVPEWFLRHGFEGTPKTSPDGSLTRIEGLVTGIAADVADLKRRQEGGASDGA